MASVVDICNSALNQLGASVILSLTENSKNGRLCNQRYEPIRDSVFRSHPWNCLMKRVELAQDSTTPAFEYTYQYTLPTDCLRVMRTEKSNISGGEEYRIEGRKLLTDEATVKLLYLAKITDPNEYDTLLLETLSAAIAADLAYAVTASTSLAANMYQLYQNKLKEARFADATENSVDFTDAIQADDFLNARL